MNLCMLETKKKQKSKSGKNKGQVRTITQQEPKQSFFQYFYEPIEVNLFSQIAFLSVFILSVYRTVALWIDLTHRRLTEAHLTQLHICTIRTMKKRKKMRRKNRFVSN